eukprot:10677-Heterococcus_DN1.PRE.1
MPSATHLKKSMPAAPKLSQLYSYPATRREKSSNSTSNGNSPGASPSHRVEDDGAGPALPHSMSNSSSETCSCSGSNSVGVSESVHMFSDCRANNAAATLTANGCIETLQDTVDSMLSAAPRAHRNSHYLHWRSIQHINAKNN